MEKLMSFVNKPNSYIAGFTYIVALNAVLMIILLFTHAIVYYIGMGSLNLNYLIIYLLNLTLFSKHLYTLVATRVAKAKFIKMDIGAFIASLFMLCIIITLSVHKFELFPVTDTNRFTVTFLALMSLMSIGYTGYTRSQTISNTRVTGEKDDIDGYSVYLDRKTLRILNAAFFITPFVIIGIALKFVF